MRVKNMVKNKDWNMAFSDNQDTKALMSSEVFRNLLSMHKQNKIAERQRLDELPPPKLPDFNEILMKKAQEESESTSTIESESEDVNDESDDDATDKEDDHEKNVSTTVKSSPKKGKEDNLYETGAGESSYIDIGITSETEKLISDGIDYVKYDIVEVKKEKAPENKKEDVVDKPEEDTEEIKTAERELGLDKNAFYIYRKMMAKRV